MLLKLCYGKGDNENVIQSPEIIVRRRASNSTAANLKYRHRVDKDKSVLIQKVSFSNNEPNVQGEHNRTNLSHTAHYLGISITAPGKYSNDGSE